jgi:hypothetical protein
VGLDDNALRLTVSADVSPILGAVNQAAAGVSTAADKMAASFKAAGLSFTDAEAAMKSLGFTAAETAASLKVAGYEAQKAGAQVITRLDSAMASGAVRVAAMESGIGGMGTALGRVVAASSTLAPVFAAAFPVLGAIAAIQIIGSLVGEIEKLINKQELEAEAWQKIDHEAAVATNSENKAMESLIEQTTALTQGPLAGLDMKLKFISDHAIELGSSVRSLLEATGKEIDAEVSWGDKAKSVLGAVADIAAGQSGLAIARAITPSQGQTAGSFGNSLQKTLDTEGTAAGLRQVDEELNVVYAQMRENPGDTGLKEFAAQLEHVQILLSKGLSREALEAANNAAEQGKEKLQLEIEATNALAQAHREVLEVLKQRVEAETEALRMQVSAKDSALRSQGEGVDDTAEGFRAGSKQRIAAYQSEVEALRGTQAEAQAAMLGAQQFGTDQEYTIEKSYYDRVTALLVGYERKVTEETRVAAEERIREYQRVADVQLRAGLEAAQAQAKIAEAQVTPETTAGRKGTPGLSPQQELAAKKQVLQDELTAEQEAILDRIQMLDSSDTEYLAKWQALQDQLVKVAQDANLRIAELNRQASQQMNRSWASAFQQINTPLTTAIDGMINGTTRASVAFARMGAGILDSVVNSLIQMTLKTGEHMLAQIALHQMAGTAQVATASTTAATTQSIDVMTSIKAVTHAAAAAAAKAYSAVSEIPVVGPVLAPAAAAAAFAGVMAFESLASAEKGAILPNDTLLLAHRNEMVLPDRVSQSVQRMAESGSSGGGQPNIHFAPNFAPQINAIDQRGMDRVMEEQSRAFYRMISRGVRNGNLKLR